MDGISLNRWFYGDWGGGKDCMNLADDDYFTEVEYGKVQINIGFSGEKILGFKLLSIQYGPY